MIWNCQPQAEKPHGFSLQPPDPLKAPEGARLNQLILFGLAT